MNKDDVANLLFPKSKGIDTHCWGSVKAVNEDGSYQVSMNSSEITTRCAAGCTARVGDRVLVCRMANGRCVVIAKKKIVEQKVLWTGELLMSLNQEVPLSEPISEQPNGIVLVWSFYDGSSSANSDWCYHFVPKFAVINSITSGGGIHVQLGNSTWSSLCQKYVYVHDEKLKGNDANKTGNASSFVLRYVLGV